MSEMQMILNELNRLRERVAHLETRQEHPGFAASDVARKSLTLSQFAATTSAELAGVLSDETGSGGGFVRATSPTLVTPALGAATATSVTATGLGEFTGGLKVDASTNATFDALYFRNSNSGASAVTRLSFRASAGEQLIVDAFSGGFTGTIDGVALASMVRLVARSTASSFMIVTESTAPLYLGANNTVDVTIANGGDVTVHNSLSVNGNTTLGNASTDTITHTGRAIFRTVASDPKHATAGSRPAGSVGEIVYYAAKMYFCTNAATPLWELFTSA